MPRKPGDAWEKVKGATCLVWSCHKFRDSADDLYDQLIAHVVQAIAEPGDSEPKEIDTPEIEAFISQMQRASASKSAKAKIIDAKGAKAKKDVGASGASIGEGAKAMDVGAPDVEALTKQMQGLSTGGKSAMRKSLRKGGAA